MKVLVLGGNRFVGKRLVGLLKKGGHHVTLLNRSGEGECDSLIKSNRNDLGFLKSEFKDRSFDWVYDFSCITPKDALNAISLLEGKVKKYIVISSQSVYDSGKDLKEEDFKPSTYPKFTPEDESLSYNESKRQMESVFFNKSGLNVIAVRFPIILGLDDYTKRLHFHVEKVRKEEEIYFPNPKAHLSFVDSKEASEFLLELKDKDFSGPINFCSKKSIELKSLMKSIEESLNKKTIYAKNPTEKNHSPFGIEEDWFMSVEKAESLGFKSSSLSEWLPELIKDLSLKS